MIEWLNQHGPDIAGGLAVGLLIGYVLIAWRLHRRLRRAAKRAENARIELAESEQRYRLLAENATDVIWTARAPDLEITYVSPSVERLLGVPVAELVGRRLPDIVVPEQRDWFERLFANRLQMFRAGRYEQSAAQRLEVRQLAADGREIIVEMVSTLTVNDNHRLTGIQGISRNISERRQAENESRARQRILAGLAEAAQLLFNSTGSTRAVDRALATLGQAAGADRIYVFENHYDTASNQLLASMRHEWVARGISKQIDNPEMQNMPYAETIPNWGRLLESGEAVNAVASEVAGAEKHIMEDQEIQSILVMPIFINGLFWGQIGFDLCTRDARWSRAEEDALRVAAGTIGAAIKGLRAEQELQRLVNTDSLTGVSSRRRFLDEARQAFRKARSQDRDLGILIMDLDHFKHINDSHGHAAGDEVLQAFTDTCHETLGEAHLVGRMGGEEFAALLRETDQSGALALAEKLCSAVRSTPISLSENGEVKLSVSIGVASMQPGEREFSSLLHRADQALYAAKRQGRDCVVEAQ